MAKPTIQDLENIDFLRAALDGFQAQMLEYFHAGTTTAERRQRAKQITDKLRVIKFQDGTRKFTIGAKKAVKGKATAAGASNPQVGYICPEGFFCCNGACVPNGTACIE